VGVVVRGVPNCHVPTSAHYCPKDVYPSLGWQLIGHYDKGPSNFVKLNFAVHFEQGWCLSYKVKGSCCIQMYLLIHRPLKTCRNWCVCPDNSGTLNMLFSVTNSNLMCLILTVIVQCSCGVVSPTLNVHPNIICHSLSIQFWDYRFTA
jgi:hypothetical protein